MRLSLNKYNKHKNVKHQNKLIKQKITTNILIYLEQELNKLETILTFIYLIIIEDCF